MVLRSFYIWRGLRETETGVGGTGHRDSHQRAVRSWAGVCRSRRDGRDGDSVADWRDVLAESAVAERNWMSAMLRQRSIDRCVLLPDWTGTTTGSVSRRTSTNGSRTAGQTSRLPRFEFRYWMRSARSSPPARMLSVCGYPEMHRGLGRLYRGAVHLARQWRIRHRGSATTPL